ncbi:MFS transporter [Microbacterium sp. STN6]|uniref:MFS transporter n=1 Tax=Microbacterium sp. STN6 TaxID=2995588 RepID=UPI002260B35A|nr:MFS transporter [Microbacterium sp. STN6]MCX7521211.1 MFS transporter [Microbacterium sp. STN6]
MPERHAGAQTAATGTEPAQRRVLLVLSAGQILGGVGTGAAVSLGSLLAVAVSGSDSFAGLASTMSTLGAAIFAIPLARLAGISGRRSALTIGTVSAAVGAVVVVVAAVIHAFPLLLAGFAVLGAGSAVNLQTRFAALDLAAARTRGRDLSLVIWATTVGVVVGPNLAPMGDDIGFSLGLPHLTGAFVLAAACQLLAGIFYLIMLRPDPLLWAKARAGVGLATEISVESALAAAPTPRARRRWVGLEVLRTNRVAVAAIVALALSQAIMVAIMAMTPVHMRNDGADIVIIGFTLSLHTAGMFALSPLFGWLSDRFGRVRVILLGQLLFVASLVTNWVAENNMAAVGVALALLGLGWSASTIAASTLLTDSLAVGQRTSVQGFSDTVMNLCGAAGGALAGPVLAGIGYGPLNAATLVCVVAVLAALAFGFSRTVAAVAEPVAPVE